MCIRDRATANDGNLLDLDNIELSQSSTVVATDPDTGAQETHIKGVDVVAHKDAVSRKFEEGFQCFLFEMCIRDRS